MSDTPVDERRDAKDAWVETVLGFKFVAETTKPQGGTESGKKPLGRVPGPGEKDELGLGLDDYFKATVTMFDMAGRKAEEQVKHLAGAIEKFGKKKKDNALKEIAKKQLPYFLEEHRSDLSQMLKQTAAQPGLLPKVASDLIKAAEEFLDGLDSDPRVAACDDNPFKEKVSIFETYRNAALCVILVSRAAAA